MRTDILFPHEVKPSWLLKSGSKVALNDENYPP